MSFAIVFVKETKGSRSYGFVTNGYAASSDSVEDLAEEINWYNSNKIQIRKRINCRKLSNRPPADWRQAHEKLNLALKSAGREGLPLDYQLSSISKKEFKQLQALVNV